MIHELSKYFEDKIIRRIEIDTDNILYIKCVDGSTIVIPNLANASAVVPFKKGAYTIAISQTKGILPKWLREED